MTKVIARNSAPAIRNKAAALKKARIRNNTEWTGLRALTTNVAVTSNTAANR